MFSIKYKFNVQLPSLHHGHIKYIDLCLPPFVGGGSVFTGKLIFISSNNFGTGRGAIHI